MRAFQEFSVQSEAGQGSSVGIRLDRVESVEPTEQTDVILVHMFDGTTYVVEHSFRNFVYKVATVAGEVQMGD